MINKQKLAELVEYTTEALPEDAQIEGNASAIDEETDERTNRYIYEQLEAGNEWAWCTVKVTAAYGEMHGTAYLGCCSYKSQDDFEKDAYYVDIKSEALDDLFQEITDAKKRIVKITTELGEERR